MQRCSCCWYVGEYELVIEDGEDDEGTAIFEIVWRTLLKVDPLENEERKMANGQERRARVGLKVGLARRQTDEDERGGSIFFWFAIIIRIFSF